MIVDPKLLIVICIMHRSFSRCTSSLCNMTSIIYWALSFNLSSSNVNMQILTVSQIVVNFDLPLDETLPGVKGQNYGNILTYDCYCIRLLVKCETCNDKTITREFILHIFNLDQACTLSTWPRAAECHKISNAGRILSFLKAITSD